MAKYLYIKGYIYISLYSYINTYYPLVMTNIAMVCHGIDGPNRNRWFTELNRMGIFHMANWLLVISPDGISGGFSR